VLGYPLSLGWTAADPPIKDLPLTKE
jgi:hypothetical protein